MFSITPSEVLLIVVVALIVFGPRKLIELSRDAGRIVGQLRRTADELRSGLQDEIRELKVGLEAEVGEIEQLKTGLTEDVGKIAAPFREASTTLAASGKELIETAEGELKWVDKPVPAAEDAPSEDIAKPAAAPQAAPPATDTAARVEGDGDGAAPNEAAAQ